MTRVKLRVKESLANAGQWYVALRYPSCTFALSAWVMLPVRKSIKLMGSTAS